MALASRKSNREWSSENNSITMLDYVRKKYGLTRTWMAAQIGLSQTGLLWCERNGLTDEQAQKLQEAIREMGRDLSKFEIPPSMKRG